MSLTEKLINSVDYLLALNAIEIEAAENTDSASEFDSLVSPLYVERIKLKKFRLCLIKGWGFDNAIAARVLVVTIHRHG